MHHFLSSTNILVLMKWLAILVLLFVIIGYFQKIACLLHWWVSFSFLYSATIIDGGDQIASILTFLLIPICFLDNRKNHWNLKIPLLIVFYHGIFSFFFPIRAALLLYLYPTYNFFFELSVYFLY